MSIVDSAWLATGATSRRISAASHADVQMTAGVEPSSRAGVFSRMVTSRVRSRHASASISCCMPPRGATTPFRARRVDGSPGPNRSDALRDAGSPAYRPWTNGPRSHGVAWRPRTRVPHSSTVSSGRGRREPRAVAVANRATSASDSPGVSMATASAAGGRYNQLGSPTVRSTASGDQDRGTPRRREHRSASRWPQFRRDRVASGALRSGHQADRSSR